MRESLIAQLEFNRDMNRLYPSTYYADKVKQLEEKLMVATHSQPNKRYFVFSGYQDIEPEYINQGNTNQISMNLKGKGINFIELKGRYKGKDEVSFLVTANDQTEKFVRHYCLDFKQESYLELTNHKHGMYKATLVTFVPNASETRAFAGYMRQFDKAMIDLLGLDYSMRPAQTKDEKDEYYTIWPTDVCTGDDFKKEVDKAVNDKKETPKLKTFMKEAEFLKELRVGGNA